MKSMKGMKSVEELKGIHEVQLLTYMKLAGTGQGFLKSFNVRRLKQDLKSFVLWFFMLFMSFMVNKKCEIAEPRRKKPRPVSNALANYYVRIGKNWLGVFEKPKPIVYYKIPNSI
jgi:hypothetical protein